MKPIDLNEFVGQPLTPAVVAAVESKIKQYLLNLMERGEISRIPEYDFFEKDCVLRFEQASETTRRQLQLEGWKRVGP